MLINSSHLRKLKSEYVEMKYWNNAQNTYFINILTYLQLTYFLQILINFEKKEWWRRDPLQKVLCMIKRWWSSVKEKLMDLFKTSANKDYCKLFCINSVHRVGKKLGLVNDSLVDNFTCNVYHMNCKHCMKGLWKMWRVWGL